MRHNGLVYTYTGVAFLWVGGGEGQGDILGVFMPIPTCNHFHTYINSSPMSLTIVIMGGGNLVTACIGFRWFLLTQGGFL